MTGVGSEFLDIARKAWATMTTKIDKLDFVKMKNYYA